MIDATLWRKRIVVIFLVIGLIQAAWAWFGMDGLSLFGVPIVFAVLIIFNLLLLLGWYFIGYEIGHANGFKSGFRQGFSSSYNHFKAKLKALEEGSNGGES